MNKVIQSFSTREIALLVWITIFLFLSLFSKKIRDSIFQFLERFLVKQILVTLLLFFLHTATYAFLLSKFGLWDISLLKDTIFWTVGFGIIALLSINKVNSKTYFKEIFIDAIKWTIAIEFILNFFTFSLVKELILLPILIFASLLQAVASLDEKNKQIENVIKKIVLYFSVFIFFFALYKTITNYYQLFTLNNLRSFLLPVLLTITFLPFMYLFNLFVKYESLWVLLKFFIKNDNDRKKVKWRILWVANISIEKVVSVSKNIGKPINIYNDLSIEMIKKVSKGKYKGFDE